ncbi:uncharacterized protein LOC104878882 [Vitis vinifera]|uniref:uncharacterized protein LOC104878882 n=1 Tax=Vitis vinifera TaxID=29760 RepID=UPI00054013C8|nr:uncharacterized protein LOC104878882 [Vitis vinifera]|eukprot:XP_010648083.1 PREDICTED: uncharacterized protein LOC104878882 [Vitis vinifera]
MYIPVDAIVRPLLIESRSVPIYCCLIDETELDDGLPWYHDIYHFLRLNAYPEAAIAMDKRALRQVPHKRISNRGVHFRAEADTLLQRYGIQHHSSSAEFPENVKLRSDFKDTMPPRRPASSQNSQANDDIPPPPEALPSMSTKGLYRYLRTLAGLVEGQARATGSNGQGQSSSTRGSSFYDFKKLGPPYFSGTSDPTEVEAWIMKIEKFFDVIDCSEEQKALYAAFMLDKEADHWWHMTKRLLEDQGPIVWSQFREAFYKKYFPDSVRRQKVGEFVRLEQGDLTMAQYEAKFTELSRFAPQLIATEEEKTLKFQDGLKPYLKNKISILKLSVYSEVVDRALIAEKDNEELHQYREQQRKRNRNDGAHGNQAQKRFALSRNQNKGKATQNLDGICPTCGKKHRGRSCYRETGACFGCGKQGHMVRDCPESRKFVFGKPKEENKDDR